MIRVAIFDNESASLNGSAYGEDVAVRTAARMAAADLSDDKLEGIGLSAMFEIASRAGALEDAGFDSHLVTIWVKSAADTFSAKLEEIALELIGRDARH